MFDMGFPLQLPPDKAPKEDFTMLDPPSGTLNQCARNNFFQQEYINTVRVALNGKRLLLERWTAFLVTHTRSSQMSGGETSTTVSSFNPA